MNYEFNKQENWGGGGEGRGGLILFVMNNDKSSVIIVFSIFPFFYGLNVFGSFFQSDISEN